MIGDLANHVWQSTLFAAGIWLLTRVVRQNHARVRYWLWFAASVKFLLPFALLASIGHQIHWAPDTPQRWSPAAMAVAQINEPFSDEIVIAAPAPPTSDGPTGRRFAWQTVVFVIWGLGVAAIALMRLQLWRRLRRLVGVSTPADIVGVDLPADVQVRFVPGGLEPGVIGIFRPILLLPSGIQDYLPPRQLQAVVAHELCHVRRRDNLTAAIHMLTEGVFWFHPMIWWIGSRLVEARERACDEDVLRELGDPDAYAEGILNVCKLYVRTPLVCVSGVSGADLQTRLEAIVSNRRSRRLTAGKAATLVVTGMLGISIPVGIGAVAHRQTNQRPDLERRAPSRPPQVAFLEPEILLPVVPAEAPRQVQSPPVAPVAAASPGQVQLPDTFRISGGPNRAQNRIPADPGAERQLEEAFLSGRTFADLSLAADVTFRQLNRAEYAVQVNVRIAPGNELTVGRGERSRLDFIAAVTDPFGTTVANMRDAAELTLDAAAIPALAKTPIIYDTSFTLLPGRYELKVLARDQTTGRIGSTTVSFTVPNLNRQQAPAGVAGSGPLPALPATGGERLIVLFFDVATMEPDAVRKATATGVQFVTETMTNADSLAVVTIGTRLRVVKDFTSSREELKTALESPGLLNETAPDVGALARNPIRQPADAATSSDVRLRAVTTLCQSLAPSQQRKTVLYFTSGLNLTGAGPDELRAATNACVRANVTMYPVDGRGLRAVVSPAAAR